MLIPCAPRGTRLFSFDSAANKPIKQIVPTYIICIDANDPKKWPRPFWAWPRLGGIRISASEGRRESNLGLKCSEWSCLY